jgi:hypothetical protein
MDDNLYKINIKINGNFPKENELLKKCQPFKQEDDNNLIKLTEDENDYFNLKDSYKKELQIIFRFLL